MIKFAAILSSILIGSFGYSFAQKTTINLREINEERLRHNQKGMTLLGGWAAANMIAGGIGMTQSTGNVRYFHQMNLAWNSVNFAIAAMGYFGAKTDPSTFTFKETVEEYQKFENILLFNAGLDMGYIATGAYLWERGLRKENDRLKGYGQSLILQGAFLFTFDTIMFFVSRNKSSKLIHALDGITIQATGMSYRLQF